MHDDHAAMSPAGRAIAAEVDRVRQALRRWNRVAAAATIVGVGVAAFLSLGLGAVVLIIALAMFWLRPEFIAWFAPTPRTRKFNRDS